MQTNENEKHYDVFMLLLYFLWICNEENNFDDATSEFFYMKNEIFIEICKQHQSKKYCTLFIIDIGILVLYML